MLVDEAAQVVASAAREYPISAPQPGWAEQDPGLWWRATCEATREVVATAGEVTVSCISFSGQMHGTILTDEQGTPLRPAIIWADQRSGREVAGFLRTVPPDVLANETANPLATGFQLATLLWSKEHEPDVLRAARRVLLPKDWVRLKMTGVAATDPSDACSTLLFNTERRDWSHQIIEAAGLRTELFPPVMRSTDISGELKPDAARDLGLPHGIPIAVGAGDTPATAVGNGVIDPGTIQSTIGSGGQLVAPTSVLHYDPRLRTHTFCHVPDNRWYVMGATLSAGLSLKWLRQSVLGQESLEYAVLSEEASTVAPGAEGLVFLPYLTGERTPHMDPNSCGVFFGLTPRHGQAHLVRAVMEGVVFALKEGLDVITTLGIVPQTVVAAGGGARSPLWRQIQADVFGVPVRQAAQEEAAAYGAALIAGCAAGWWPNLAGVPSYDIRPVEVAEPDPGSATRYAELFDMYRDLYSATREIMAKRSRIVEDHLSR
jgi:xylulokinase